MGLFSMWFGPKAPEFKERIWSTAERKMTDLVTQVRASQDRGIPAVAIVHFKATHTLLLEALEHRGVRYWTVTNPAQFPFDIGNEMHRHAALLVLDSAAIPSSVPRTVQPRAKDTSLPELAIHLAEHYPLLDRDRQVLALDKVWPMPISFTCYTGLDEPWLAPFGVEKVRNLLTQLGMDENVILEHPFLSRSFESARKKLGRQVRREQSCDSCEDWMRRNLPSRA